MKCMSLKQALVAGKADAPVLLMETDSPDKEVRQLKKQLQASPDWQLKGDTAWNPENTYFNGIATWGKTIAVEYTNHEYRFRLLRLDRLGVRSIYAIPVKQVESFSELPSIDLSSDEIALIKQMANELLHKCLVQEDWFQIRHPSKPALKEERRSWKATNFNSDLLLSMLEREPVLKDIFVAALDAQFRCFLDGTTIIPSGIFNFVLQPKNQDAGIWFCSVLQAVTFTTSPAAPMTGPIVITLKDAADLKRWQKCCEQVAVIQTATGALLWPMLEDLEEYDRIMKCGGFADAVFTTTPISLTRTRLGHLQAVDILLPLAPGRLDDVAQDTLRAAMSRLVRRNVAECVFDIWNQERSSPAAYRRNSFTVWQDVLLQVALETWFPDQEQSSAVNSLRAESQQRQEEQERQTAEVLQRGIDLLTKPEAYKADIIDRPGSQALWSAAMQEGKVAFWFKPAKGDCKCKTLLAFSPDTLRSLLLRVGCDETLYKIFLDRCENQGILNSRKRTITLGQGTFNAVTFDTEKF